MNNTECAVAVIARHREARTWTDVAVAANLLAELGLDPNGNAAHATANVDARRVTEDQVAAAEGVAHQHAETAAALRARLDEQEAPARAAEAETKRQRDLATARHVEAQREAAQRLQVSEDERAAIDKAETERVEAERKEAERVSAETQRAAAAETERVEAERVEAHRVAEQAEHAEKHEADTAHTDAA